MKVTTLKLVKSRWLSQINDDDDDDDDDNDNHKENDTDDWDGFLPITYIK